MTRSLAVALVVGALGLLALTESGLAGDYETHHEAVMGTSLGLRVRADSEAAARRAEAAILAEIERLSETLSGYDAESEFRRWADRPQAGAIRVSSELFEVLEAADRWRERTAGAFDARAAVFGALWKAGQTKGERPSRGELQTARAGLIEPAWRLDRGRMTAERVGRTSLTLDGIAKGSIVEKACAAGMRCEGVRGLVLDVGGDLRVAGEMAAVVAIGRPGEASVTAEPLTTIEVRDRAVATSANTHRGYRIDGRWYSHILDPRTGEPAEHVSGATVVAPRSIDADALATALNVLKPEVGIRLVEQLEGVECVIVGSNGRVFRSHGFEALERVSGVIAGESETADAAVAKAPKMELRLTFEINRPEETKGRYRRPYIAAWVEDASGKPVRNLALWVSLGGSGPRQWLPDLRRWFRAEEERKKRTKEDRVLVLAQSTRVPGKYTLTWDGTDDNREPLPPGEYTLFLEAAREHGTYQLMRTPVVLDGPAVQKDLGGGVEIKSATVEYRAKN